jgi:hypothetical protein
MSVAKKQWNLIQVIENVVFPDKPTPLPTLMKGEKTIEVPDETQFVHVAVTGMKVFFGSDPKNNVPSNLACMSFDIQKGPISKNPGGKWEFTFTFYAILQNAKTYNPTGKWTGLFNLEVMCFG